MTSNAETPKLIRGFSDLYTGSHGVAQLALSALADVSDSNWLDIQLNEVKVEDVSGHGGSKTYKISAPTRNDKPSGSVLEVIHDISIVSTSPLTSTCQIPTVLLHSRPDDHEPHFMQRLGAAHDAFAVHNLAPERIASGGNWFMSSWEGIGTAKLKSDEDWERGGALLAKVHSQVDPSWFTEHRHEMLERVPKLAESQRPAMCGCSLLEAASGTRAPSSPATARRTSSLRTPIWGLLLPPKAASQRGL